MGSFFIDHIVNDGDKFEIKLEKGAFIEIGNVAVIDDSNQNQATLINVINGGVYEVGQQLLLEGTSVIIALRVEINAISGNNLLVNNLPNLSVGTIKEYRIYKLAFRLSNLAVATQEGTSLGATELNRLVDTNGDTMTGQLNLVDPVDPENGANKKYVDDKKINIRNRPINTNLTGILTVGQTDIATTKSMKRGDIIELELSVSDNPNLGLQIVRGILGVTALTPLTVGIFLNNALLNTDIRTIDITHNNDSKLIFQNPKNTTLLDLGGGGGKQVDILFQPLFIGNIWLIGSIDI